ncbi:MAG: T9SS type A sorting domain-containing protein, partial [Bacteroidota bacterium]
LLGEELTYTVRFQNTGTDTAFTVQIRDTIDSDLDMASLRIVSSSHNVFLDVKNENIVTFIFENILLPDSGANEAASNGFVKFAIKPKPGLAEYTQVTNKAYIYFDYNSAVVTNQVLNTFVSNPVSGIEAITVADQSMNIYPNPATNYLTIETTQPSQIEILNLQGQIIQKSNTAEKSTSIDVSGFPKGLYFVKVIPIVIGTENNISVKKFVKQ